MCAARMHHLGPPSDDKPKPVEDLKEAALACFSELRRARSSPPHRQDRGRREGRRQEVGRAFESIGSEVDKLIHPNKTGTQPPQAAPQRERERAERGRSAGAGASERRREIRRRLRARAAPKGPARRLTQRVSKAELTGYDSGHGAPKSRLFRLLVSLSPSGAASWIAACGSSDGSKFGDGSGIRNGDAGFNSSSGFLPNGGDGGDGTNGEGGPGVNDTLRIEPATITVTATGTLSSLSGCRRSRRTSRAAPIRWTRCGPSTTRASGGSTAPASSRPRPSPARRRCARVGNLVALAEVTVLLKIEETNGTVTDDQKTKLKAGGSADTAKFKWLYPYDKTVFPRGLLPPKLMFGGATPTAYFVRLSTKNVDYSGY